MRASPTTSHDNQTTAVKQTSLHSIQVHPVLRRHTCSQQHHYRAALRQRDLARARSGRACTPTHPSPRHVTTHGTSPAANPTRITELACTCTRALRRLQRIAAAVRPSSRPCRPQRSTPVQPQPRLCARPPPHTAPQVLSSRPTARPRTQSHTQITKRAHLSHLCQTRNP